MKDRAFPLDMKDTQVRWLLESLSDGAYVVDRERRILFWNKAAERISGYSAAEILRQYCFENRLMHVDRRGCGLCSGPCPLATCIRLGSGVSAEIFLHHKAGHRIPVTVQAIPHRNGDGEVVGAIEIFNEHSTLSAAQATIHRLEEMAYIDPLTGLANRRYTEVFLRSRHSELQRYNWPYGVIFMDIDDFKGINDRFGHDTGDRVLQMIARTVQHNARHHDLIGRWGGEEFLAVLVNVSQTLLMSLAEKFRVLAEESSLHGERPPVRVTLSCGAAMARPEDTEESLVKRADERMYQAKRTGKNRVVF